MSRRVRRRLSVFVFLVAVALAITAPAAARADGLIRENQDGFTGQADGTVTTPPRAPEDAQNPPKGSGRDAGSARASGKSKYSYVSKAKYAKLRQEYEARVNQARATNRMLRTLTAGCATNLGPGCNPDPGSIAGPGDFNVRIAADPASPANRAPAAPPPVTIPPEEIAYMAMARLRLTAPKPGIGPPPEINEWDMAAVGYPLWLWADGNLDPAPVSDAVFDVSVSLDARLERVIFDMGDGNDVRCTVLDRRWTRAVDPGTESPVCGYRYTEPSLPKGDYTVTAQTVWAVDWTINGTSGTIPFYQRASTTLPVGELQVLER